MTHVSLTPKQAKAVGALLARAAGEATVNIGRHNANDRYCYVVVNGQHFYVTDDGARERL